MDVTVSVGHGEEYREVAVADLAELDRLLDRIAAESDPDQPTVVPVTRGDTIMSIAQGPRWAIVTCQYLQADGYWLEHGILGDRDADGTVVVLFAGEWTELLRWRCTDIEDAREAVRFFYRTGALWPEVAWVSGGIEQLIPAQTRFDAGLQYEEVTLAWARREMIASTEDAMDSVLDGVVERGDPGCPNLVTVTRHDSRLSLAQGPDWAILSFVDAEGATPEHVSFGDLQAQGEVTVMQGRERSTYPRWQCIDPSLAREAMRDFYRTGSLWPGVSWVPSRLVSALTRLREL